MADGKITFDTSLDNSGLERGLRSLKHDISPALKKLGGLIVAAFSVRALVNFGKECVALGSAIAEVQNVVDVAFGEMSYKIEAFADTAVQTFGMSKLSAKKTASTYMAMARGMGIAEEAASDMAISLTGLSGDVASFFNISQELADTKLKSVFTGETETLKDLGVVMTQTNLKAYALEKGITKDISAMTQAELVSLRYGFVMKQLSLAQGDFARTSDSWANQTRILSERWKEFMSIVGDSLIKVFTPLLQTLNEIVSSLIQVATAVNQVITALFGATATGAAKAGESTEQISGAIGESVENQEAMTDAVEDTEKAQKKSVATFDEINKLSGEAATNTTASGGEAGGAISVVPPEQSTEEADGFVQKFLRAFEEVKTAVGQVVEAFKGAWDKISQNVTAAVAKIKASVGGLVEPFQEAWNDIAALGVPLASWFDKDVIPLIQAFVDLCGDALSGLLDTFGKVFSDVWSLVIAPALETWATDILPLLTQVITQIISTLDVLVGEVKRVFDMIWSDGVAPALALIGEIWSDCWDSITAAWEKWGAPIFENIKTAIQATADTLVNIWSTIIKPVWDTILEAVKTLWKEHLQPLFDRILNFIGTLINNALRIYNEFILPIVNWLVTVLGPTFTAVFQTVADIALPILGGIIDAISGIVEAFTGLSNFITGIFTQDWELAWQGLQEIVSGVFDAIGGAFSGVLNGIITAVEGFVNFFISGVNSIINALNSISFDVPDWIPLIGGNHFGLNIPNVPELSIPRLAQGAVIPPNREFMAVLGDQRSGTNIEAPLDTIKQGLREVMAEAGGSRSGPLEVRLILSAKPGMAREMKFELDRESKRQGVKLVQGVG